MPSSDYNKYLAAIKAANDMENKELLRQIKNELIANYGLWTTTWTICSGSSATTSD